MTKRMLSSSSNLLDETERAPYRFVNSISSKGFHTLAYRYWSNQLGVEADDTKTSVMCLHGLTRNCRDFDYLAESLSEDRRVICPDTVGRGNSDWLRDHEDYSLSQYNLDVAVVAADSGLDVFDIVGTSLGGLMGMVLAGMDRTKIRRLVINDIAPEIPMWALQRLSKYLGENPLFDNLKDVEEYMQEKYAPIKPMKKKHWRNMAKHGTMKTNEGYRLAYDPTIAENYRRYWLLMYFNIWEFWEQIQCPVLVLRGAESDFLTEGLVNRMQDSLPHAQFMEFDGIGHTLSLNSKKQINIVRDFLDAE